MAEFKRGDWVVFAPGYKSPEIGRVTSVGAISRTCFVCYTHGCTAELTPCEKLVPYDPERFPDLEPDDRIGHHRFDEDGCPDYDPDACFASCRGSDA